MALNYAPAKRQELPHLFCGQGGGDNSDVWLGLK